MSASSRTDLTSQSGKSPSSKRRCAFARNRRFPISTTSPLEHAVQSLPNCEVLALKHLPNITLEHLRYAREEGYRRFGAHAKRIEDSIKIVFNDEHPPQQVCVNVMEELFHVRLGHRTDIVSRVAVAGNHRTYDALVEEEAYGCGIATLVPFTGLQAMLAQQFHVRRIAEHCFVPVDVVQERIAAANLGDLPNAQIRQFALVPEHYAT